MNKKITKDDPEWAVFRDVFKLYEDYAEPETSEEYWDSLVKSMGDFVHSHDNSILARRLAIAIGETLNEKAKEGK